MSEPLPRPLVVLSPHLDDAVLGCGQLLAAHPGALVVTLFAGRPADDAPLTEWDAAAGFRPGDDVVATRRREDAAALALLGARPLWLPLRDAQYGGDESVEAIARSLGGALAAVRPRCLLMPLGLFHSDHLRTREAALCTLPRLAAEALVYADGLYAAEEARVQSTLAALRARGAVLERACPRLGPLVRKAEALACYASQLRALATPGRPGLDAALRPERLWRLEWPARPSPSSS